MLYNKGANIENCIICYMCLAIPGKIQNIDKDNIAQVDFDGLVQKVSLDLVKNAQIGNFVLVHAGYAIEILDIKQAQKTLNLIKEMQ